jgi:hypothetical protein
MSKHQKISLPDWVAWLKECQTTTVELQCYSIGADPITGESSRREWTETQLLSEHPGIAASIARARAFGLLP